MSVLTLSHPTKKIAGSITLPSSKSISNRALVLQAISTNSISIQNLSEADDTVIMQTALTKKNGELYLKNAGTCMRFLTAYFAATDGSDITLLCDSRMEKRPIDELVNALKKLGADINYLKQEGFPPLHIKGKNLLGGNITISAKASSQFVSALMMIAPLCTNDLHITLQGEITSAPYIEMTAKLMKQFGLDVDGLLSIVDSPQSAVRSPNFQLPDSKLFIEPDWSAASYWYQLVALSNEAEILLPNLSLNSLQGDVMIAQHMEYFGVQTKETNKGIIISKSKTANSNSKTINLQHHPDLAPTLALTAAATNMPLLLTGLQNLVIKESNRLQALETELTKLGFHVIISNDSLEVIPLVEESVVGSRQSAVSKRLPYILQHHTSHITHHTSHISTYNDHRMAMAFAPLALLFDNIAIENPDVVEKSYPHFWDDLKRVGFSF